MFTTELVLMAAGLVIAFCSRGNRRILFHSAIALFLISFSLGSIPLVIGGIAILGMGMIEDELSNESCLRGKVYAATGTLLFASVAIPAMHSNRNDRVGPSLTDDSAHLEMHTAADDLLGLNQKELLDLVSENQGVVNELAQELLGDARRRVVQVARQSNGLDLETTIDFKAPAQLIGTVLGAQQVGEINGQVENSVSQVTTGKLKIHAALNDAKTCNQCHDVGATPLHTELSYEWSLDDGAQTGAAETVPLDPDLMVLAN